MKIFTLFTFCIQVLQIVATSSELTEVQKLNIEREKSLWGRLYIKNTPIPIQYIKGKFGGVIPADEGNLVLSKDEYGCTNTSSISSQIDHTQPNFLLVKRGKCTFREKAILAQEMGMKSVIITSTSEEVTPPVAILEKKDNITIATMMIRKTAGDMLRKTMSLQEVKLRTIPIVCKKGGTICNGLLPDEKKYIKEHITSGYITLSNDDNKDEIGKYAQANFGATLPSSSFSVQKAKPFHGCDALINTQEVKDKYVLIERGSCSFLQKASMAQNAGASGVIIQSLGPDIVHPRTLLDWEGYNITIPCFMVNDAAGETLLEKTNKNTFEMKSSAKIHKLIDNMEILADVQNWPKNNTQNFVYELLKQHMESSYFTSVIKHFYFKLMNGKTEEINEIEKKLQALNHASTIETVSHTEL